MGLGRNRLGEATMWAIAGVLLGLVVLASLVGFHTGPHSHFAAGVLGTIAALWLAIMALDGRSSALLWTLFGADMVLTAGVSSAAWKALGVERLASATRKVTRIEGAEGFAKTDLSPDGVVRVRGEDWSASSVNGDVAADAPIRVVSVDGIRLNVWAEEPHMIDMPLPERKAVSD
jgi:membrane-bound ClpP family serine protease